MRSFVAPIRLVVRHNNNNAFRRLASSSVTRAFAKLWQTDGEVPARNPNPLSILKYPHPLLRAENKEITVFDEELKSVVKHMFEIMYETHGMGLAAPQVGVNKRLMVFNADDQLSPKEERVFVNPKILSVSSDTALVEEGCLSFPMIYGLVERHKSVVIGYQDLDGKQFEQKLVGKPAVIFQHEYDHLNKVLFIDLMVPRYLKINAKRIAKMVQRYALNHADGAV